MKESDQKNSLVREDGRIKVKVEVSFIALTVEVQAELSAHEQ